MVKKMADEYDEELLNRFADVAEELGWTSDWDLKDGYFDMENSSPAGGGSNNDVIHEGLSIF